MTTDEDRARLIAAVTIAAQSAQSAQANAGDSFQERLDKAKVAMRGLHWWITVARDLKFDTKAWISHPWHCYKVKALVSQLLNQELSGLDEEEASALLARCCAMIEFGVDVNPIWYRRLRESVIENTLSAREFQSLLRHSTVWWGTHVTSTGGSNLLVNCFHFLWSMGRPSDGELLLREHHWVTKAAILTVMGLSGLALGVVAAGLVHFSFAHGTLVGAADIVSALLIYGVVFWATWWVGPSSWFAVRRLQAILH